MGSPTSSRKPIEADSRTNLDIAWRSHAAQESWTGKADAKASIFLAMNGVVLAGVLTARAQRGSYLNALGGWREGLLVTALIFCSIGALLACSAIFPLLGDPRRRGDGTGTIFFGDVRHRTTEDLARELGRLTIDEQLAQVARQLVAMSQVAWIKHRLIQAALVIAVCGYLMIIVSMTG